VLTGSLKAPIYEAKMAEYRAQISPWARPEVSRGAPQVCELALRVSLQPDET
jgi:hypothetical protein